MMEFKEGDIVICETDDYIKRGAIGVVLKLTEPNKMHISIGHGVDDVRKNYRHATIDDFKKRLDEKFTYVEERLVDIMLTLMQKGLEIVHDTSINNNKS